VSDLQALFSWLLKPVLTKMTQVIVERIDAAKADLLAAVAAEQAEVRAALDALRQTVADQTAVIEQLRSEISPEASAALDELLASVSAGVDSIYDAMPAEPS
jgi:aspartyl-tRNA synthetase